MTVAEEPLYGVYPVPNGMNPASRLPATRRCSRASGACIREKPPRQVPDRAVIGLNMACPDPPECRETQSWPISTQQSYNNPHPPASIHITTGDLSAKTPRIRHKRPPPSPWCKHLWIKKAAPTPVSVANPVQVWAIFTVNTSTRVSLVSKSHLLILRLRLGPNLTCNRRIQSEA
jgi:hypothetical protein